MSISNTNSIIDPNEERRHLLRHAISRRLSFLGHSKIRRRIGCAKHFHLKAAKCSKCKRGMDKYLAKMQKENKREYAPICIPCILGIPRKPLQNKDN